MCVFASWPLIEWMIVPHFAGVLVRFRRRADSGGDLSAGWVVAGVMGSMVIFGTCLRLGVAAGSAAGSGTGAGAGSTCSCSTCSCSTASFAVTTALGVAGFGSCLSTGVGASLTVFVSKACLLNLCCLGCCAGALPSRIYNTVVMMQVDGITWTYITEQL